MLNKQKGRRCSCSTETPKGLKYHPALKVVYERSGAAGRLVKVGYRCPKCGTFSDLS